MCIAVRFLDVGRALRFVPKDMAPFFEAHAEALLFRAAIKAESIFCWGVFILFVSRLLVVYAAKASRWE